MVALHFCSLSFIICHSLTEIFILTPVFNHSISIPVVYLCSFFICGQITLKVKLYLLMKFLLDRLRVRKQGYLINKRSGLVIIGQEILGRKL